MPKSSLPFFIGWTTVQLNGKYKHRFALERQLVETALAVLLDHGEGDGRQKIDEFVAPAVHDAEHERGAAVDMAR